MPKSGNKNSNLTVFECFAENGKCLWKEENEWYWVTDIIEDVACLEYGIYVSTPH